MDKIKLLHEVVLAAKEYEKAEMQSKSLSLKHPEPWSSRARLTSHQAKRARCAEHRDRCKDKFVKKASDYLYNYTSVRSLECIDDLQPS